MAIKLADVDLTRFPGSMDNRDFSAYSDLWALVRMDRTPLNQVRLKGPLNSLSSQDLAAEIDEACGEAALRFLMYKDVIGSPEAFRPGSHDGSAETNEVDLPFISVVACTRDRTDTLSNTLESLARLDYPSYEVIVVDNCPSSDATAELAEQYDVRYALEPRPGLDRARNRGIELSRGEIVAYIDDDAVADPNWLRAVAAGFEDPEVMCVTGLIVPFELETPAQVMFERDYWGFGRGFRRHTFRPGKTWSHAPLWPSVFGTGCNMAFRKSFFSEAGYFDPALDVGTPTGGGGDLDMFHRVMRLNHAIAYRPDALMKHKHRESINALRRQLFNNGKGFAAIFTRWALFEPDVRLKLLRMLPFWCFRCHLARILRKTVGRYNLPFGMIAAEALGTLYGPWSYIKSLRQAKTLDSNI